MAKKKNDKKNGISLKTFLWRFILTIVVVIFIGFTALDVLLGGIFLRKPMNLFYKSQSYPVNVQVKGDIFGYPINISEVMECKSGRYNNPMVGDEFWDMPNHYVYQFNADKSVTVLEVDGLLICDEDWRNKIHENITFLGRAYWFSSIESPERVKQITLGNLKEANLKLQFSKAEAGTKLTQRYQPSYISYMGDTSFYKTYKTNSYRKYFSKGATLYNKDLWSQKDYILKAVKDVKQVSKLILTKSEIEDFEKLFSNRRYSFYESRERVLSLQIDKILKFSGHLMAADNKIYKKGKFGEAENLTNRYKYEALGHAIDLSSQENISCDVMPMPDVFYLPEEEELLLIFPCFGIKYLPTEAVLKEIE
jgi:hypothetical protein